MGVRSMYFVLLRSEFYNVAARRCLETLGQIKLWGMSWACILMRRLILRLG